MVVEREERGPHPHTRQVYTVIVKGKAFFQAVMALARFVCAKTCSQLEK